MNIFLFAILGVTLSVALVLFRVMKGPTLYDRILSVNMIGTKITILLALSGYLFERPDFMDIALLYAILNVIATIAILKIVEKKTLL